MQKDYNRTALKEQHVLKISIAFTFVLAACGILFGVLAGASSILFDGIYSAIDSIFSIAALWVARMIHIDANHLDAKAPEFAKRFHSGFWHLEPILLAINGSGLVIGVIYGFFDCMRTLWHGGHMVNFGSAILFAVFGCILCMGLAWYEKEKNKDIGSDLIAVDMRSWLLSGGISFALLLGFALALLLGGTRYQWVWPYIDPCILGAITLVMAPMPLKIVSKSVRDILLITPVELDEKVGAITEAIVKRYGFTTAHYYVAKVGRSLTVEIHLVVPKDYPKKGVEFFDKVREEIGEAVGDAGPDRWLTVSFTADEKWAL